MSAQSQELSVREKKDQVVATLNHPAFLEQIEQSLPENVTLTRFVRVAITAIRANDELVSADQTSLFASIVRCAQDGLFPDGREAALVIYKNKVGYLRMIGGIRKIAAEYGWSIRTAVVYENDDFDYTEEPPSITHRPVRPGEERGELIASYAVATHRDGRREQTVLHPADIMKRRAKAQTQAVWNEFPAPMWEKSAGHDIFGQLPFDSADLRIARIMRDDFDDPAAALYGPRAVPPVSEDPPVQAAAPADTSRSSQPPTDTPQTARDSATDMAAGNQQAAGGDAEASSASPGGTAPAPGDWIEEGEWNEASEAAPDAAAAAGEQKVPGGQFRGKTLAEVAATLEGQQWLDLQLRRLKADDRMRAPIEVYVEGALPDLWAKHEAWVRSSHELG